MVDWWLTDLVSASQSILNLETVHEIILYGSGSLIVDNKSLYLILKWLFISIFLQSSAISFWLRDGSHGSQLKKGYQTSELKLTGRTWRHGETAKKSKMLRTVYQFREVLIFTFQGINLFSIFLLGPEFHWTADNLVVVSKYHIYLRRTCKFK